MCADTTKYAQKSNPRLEARVVASGGPVVPATPHLKSVPPISCLAPRLLQNPILYLKMWPPLLVFGPPVEISW